MGAFMICCTDEEESRKNERAPEQIKIVEADYSKN